MDIPGGKLYNPPMFGFVLADTRELTREEQRRYRGCYCGLCRAIGARCGTRCRMCLTYDMAFLTLLLGSLYEPPETERDGPCVLHPLGKRYSWRTEATDYAADLNVLLAYYNCLDDWEDDRRLLRLGEAGLLRAGAEAAEERRPQKAAALRECLDTLKEIEGRREKSPDPGASAFGRLMGELFLWREDRWSPILRQAGEHLGRFIYLLDALEDLEKDSRRGSYNPLKGILAEGATREEVLDILVNQMSSCAGELDKLPLVQDAAILKNILYTGVWLTLRRKGDKNA